LIFICIKKSDRAAGKKSELLISPFQINGCYGQRSAQDSTASFGHQGGRFISEAGIGAGDHRNLHNTKEAMQNGNATHPQKQNRQIATNPPYCLLPVL
jgi:hypothetical protein